MKVTAHHYKQADAICRKEYEKRFNTDLSKPTGRLFPISNKDNQIKLYKDMAMFWSELGQKQLNNTNLIKLQPLNMAIFSICSNAELKFLKLIEQINDDSEEDN